MAKKQIIINTAGGLLQEVLTNFDVEADFEVVVIQFDIEDCEHMSKHYDANVLDNDQWVQFPTLTYKDKFMPEKEYMLTVKVPIKGISPEDAWENLNARPLADSLGKDHLIDITETPPVEDRDDLLVVECGICHFEEEGPTDEIMNKWIPEVYLGDNSLDACCPDCQEKYVVYPEDMLPTIDLGKVKELKDLPGLLNALQTVTGN